MVLFLLKGVLRPNSGRIRPRLFNDKLDIMSTAIFDGCRARQGRGGDNCQIDSMVKRGKGRARLLTMNGLAVGVTG